MHSPRDDDSPLGFRGGLLILVLLLAALLFAALPLGAGVVVACIVPGLGGLRPGLGLPTAVGMLLAIVVVAVVVGDRPLRSARLLLPGHPRLHQPAAEFGAFLLLAAALLAPLASPLGSLTAAAVASATYRCLERFLLRSGRGGR